MPPPRFGSIVIGDDWTVRTELSPEDCIARLKVAAPEGWTLLSRHSVIGEFDVGGGYIRRVGFVDRIFPPFLLLRFEGDGAGSLIHGRSGLHWGLFAFVGLWTVVVLGQGSAGWQAVLNGAPISQPVLFTLVMLGLGPLLLIAARFLIRRGAGGLVVFLAETVEGRIVD